jgi:hypothetical protein
MPPAPGGFTRTLTVRATPHGERKPNFCLMWKRMIRDAALRRTSRRRDRLCEVQADFRRPYIATGKSSAPPLPPSPPKLLEPQVLENRPSRMMRHPEGGPGCERQHGPRRHRLRSRLRIPARRSGKGELLVQLNAEQEKAQLAAAQSKRDLARLDAGRNGSSSPKTRPPPRNVMPRKPSCNAPRRPAREVEALLARKRITAPFDGVLGIRQVSLGQYLGPAPIATMHSLDPIQVQFNLPQQQMYAATPGTGIAGAQRGAVPSSCAMERRAPSMPRSTRKLPRHHRRRHAAECGQDASTPGVFRERGNPAPRRGRRSELFPASAINYAPYGDSVFGGQSRHVHGWRGGEKR